MAKFDLFRDCEELVGNIKRQAWFPYKSGHLRSDATSGRPFDKDTYLITFDGTIAPYIAALEEGSRAHNIPHAFGRALPFGMRGRFNGFFHPGSEKHKGFIKDKTISYILNYFVNKYDGYVERK